MSMHDDRFKTRPIPFWMSAAHLLVGLATVFWLWSKFLYSPPLVYLPPLPPVEVFFTDVEKLFGPWPLIIFPSLAALIILVDGVYSTRRENLKFWVTNLVRGTSMAVALHLGIWVVGGLVFYTLFSLTGGHPADQTGSTRGGLILFCAFFSLILAGPATLLTISVLTVWRFSKTTWATGFLTRLNPVWSFLLVPLLVLWIWSGDAIKTARTITQSQTRTLAVSPEEFLSAIRDGNDKLVQRALSDGLDPNLRDPSNGATALQVASDYGRLKIVNALLQAHAHSNAKDRNGVTALMSAARNGELAILETLLAAGADVDTRNSFGSTALMSAAARGHSGSVRALLAAGANPNIRDNRGGTALTAALAVNNEEIAQMLKKASTQDTSRRKAP